MALSRRLGVVAILGSCWLVAVGCGDDATNSASNDAGAGGEAGDDGSSSGGTKNNGGKGGQSTAGTAGKTNGGSAGTAGAGGNSGNAGTTPVDGGTGGTGEEPVAGAGGTTDGGTGPTDGGVNAGGEGGAPVVVTELNSCSYGCNSDDDCKVGNSTAAKCNPETKKCETPDLGEPCETISNCVPFGSFWLITCADDDGCLPGEACVTWQGEGWCATPPEDGVCLTFGLPEALPHHGAQGDVEVCVDHSWYCGSNKTCQPGCTAEYGCEPGEGTCNVETALCECAASGECNTGTCEADHQCAECATHEDCAKKAGQTGLDVCVDGKCGCSGANKCPNQFKNATAVCE